MRRLLPLALVTPALSGVAAVVLAASPAHAACAPVDLPAALTSASLVVTGEVTKVDVAPEGQVYTVTVQRVYAGEATRTVQLGGLPAGQDCAVPVQVGEEWLFVSQGEAAAQPVVRADFGTTLLTPDAATVVADVLGSGTRPAGGSDAREVTLTEVEGVKRYGYWQLALPGAVLAAGGLLVLLLARALGRARTAR